MKNVRNAYTKTIAKIDASGVVDCCTQNPYLALINVRVYWDNGPESFVNEAITLMAIPRNYSEWENMWANYAVEHMVRATHYCAHGHADMCLRELKSARLWAKKLKELIAERAEMDRKLDEERDAYDRDMIDKTTYI